MDQNTSSGLRSRQSGVRFGSSGTGTGAGPKPVPGAEHLNRGPDGRDPGPENEFITADAMSSHPYPVSEFQSVAEGELMAVIILAAGGEGVIKVEERAFAQSPLSTETEVSQVGR